jgi:hypothetical protein
MKTLDNRLHIVYNIHIMVNTIKTTKIIAFATLLALVIPATSFAGKDNSGSYDYPRSGWDSYTGGSGSSYYYDTPSYDYSYDYTPSYSYGSGYSSPSYGGSSYSAPSYSGSSLGGYGYSGGSISYGSSYKPASYSGSSIPSTSYSYSSSNPNTTSSATNNTKVTASGGNANAVATGGNASSSNTNINNNVNNVYVYTNPTGNAVVHNPEYQRLDGYCVISPSNARTGQTVTATAYATGGIGNYSYTWGGDLATASYGVSTSFTSYNPGTKNISVTVRSDQDVITKNCTVTFENNPVAVNSYSNTNYGYGYGSTVTTGTPVSGVYLQPAYTQRVTTGTPVSGVYLNELPATGGDLNWMHYTIGLMVLVLATVMTMISRAKKSFVGSNE